MIIADINTDMNLPIALIQRLALEQGVNPRLLQALILIESGGNRYATQYQPTYKYFSQIYEHSRRLYITYVTEKVFQASSHGYVQIMGSTARELGFKGYPFQLYDQETNIRFGAKFISHLQKRYPNQLDIISAYNQGQPFKTPNGFYKNQEYINRVLKKMRDMEVWY